jgi:outer membrane protein assembly factor BamB
MSSEMQTAPAPKESPGTGKDYAMLRWVAAAVFAVSCATAAALATDWPQYRGPHRDGTTTEKDIATRWPKAEPKVLWRIPVGNAFGSFAVAGGKAYAYMERDGDEVLSAMNPDTGKELWSAKVDQTIHERQGGTGPRTTPTVDGDRVYVYSTYFKLACLNASDGKPVWEHDLIEEHKAQSKSNGAINKWGNAMSPLVMGDLVIVAGGGPGETFLAFDKSDGKLKWKSGNEKVTHATPATATIAGVEQVIFFCQSGLVSISPEDGKELWRFAFPFKIATASTPIVGGKNGDLVYCSAGYNVGAAVCRVTKSDGGKFTATQLWRTEGENMNHWTTPVHKDGYLYGIYGAPHNSSAPLECVDIETGKSQWNKGGFGTGGGTILIDDYVLVQSDTGAITLVKATPEKYDEVGHFQVLGGKCWTMAVYANGRIYARSDKEAVCIKL